MPMEQPFGIFEITPGASRRTFGMGLRPM